MSRKRRITTSDTNFKMMVVLVAQTFGIEPFTPMDLLRKEMNNFKIVATREQVKTALDEIAHSTNSVQRWNYNSTARFVCTINSKQPEEFRYKVDAPVAPDVVERPSPTMVSGMWIISRVSGFSVAKWRNALDREVAYGHHDRYLHIPLTDEVLLAFGFKKINGFRTTQFHLKGMYVFKYGQKSYYTMGDGSDLRRNQVFHFGHVQEDYLEFTGNMFRAPRDMGDLEDAIEEYRKSQKKRFFITENQSKPQAEPHGMQVF